MLRTFKTIIVINIFIIMTGCEALTPPDTVEKVPVSYTPQFVFEAVEIPLVMQQSADSVVQMAVDYLNLCNHLEQCIDYIIFPQYEFQQSIPEQLWEKKWNASEGFEISVSLSVDEAIYPNGETHYLSTWNVYYTGTDSIRGVYYDNWLFLQATMEDGEDTYTIFYEENTDIISHAIHWLVFSEDESRYVMELKENSETVEWIIIYTGLENRLERRKVTSTHYWEYLPVSYLVTWNPDGSGEWKRYDIDRNEIESGSWQ